LATRQTPEAYQALVYEKGAYVLHMLRMLMWDARANPPDAAFIAMMKDFAAAFADKNPSTRDFQDVVERHMTATMDLTHDRKMDWFFRQWVEGTEIPSYALKADVRAAGDGRYTISGSVAQAGVSGDFHGFLPLYLEFEKGEVRRFGLATFTGKETVPIETTLTLPKKPVRVVPNAMHDVLTRD
jgi:aminopeptidase N